MTYLPVTPKFGRRGNVDDIHVLAAQGANFEALRMSWRAIGGPHRATLRASMGIEYLADMLDYLRNGVKLYDAQGYLCWWGYVHEVRIRWGVTEVGISLDQMFNNVKVNYKTLKAGEDATEDAETDWLTNPESISEYGTKQLALNAGSLVMSAAAAEALRDTRLEQASTPQAVADYESRINDPVAEIHCRGWWDTLSWVYYSQDAGRISFFDEGTDLAQGIGQSAYTTGATVTFDDNPDGDFLSDSAMLMGRYAVGQILTISGAADADNNGLRTILEVAENGLYLRFSEDVDDDTTPDAVTLTPQGIIAAQSFTTDASMDWTVVSVAVRAKMAGTAADPLEVHIYSDSAGSPNVSLGDGSIAVADMDGVYRWRVADFVAADLPLTGGTTYWVVVQTATNDAANGYHVELSDEGYSGGTYKYNDGISWTARAGVDMPFDIVGGRRGGAIAEEVLLTSAFITGVELVDTFARTPVITTLTQIEDQTVKAVVEGVLQAGSTNGRRLLAELDQHRTITLREEPSVNDATTQRYYRDRNGTLRDHFRMKVEPQRAGEVVGNWLESEDMRSIIAPGNALAEAGRAFIEEAEWTKAGDAVRLTARGSKNIWEV
jgi:hypothetical protein